MKSTNTKYNGPPNPVRQTIEELASLSESGIDPAEYLEATMFDVPGFELGALAKEDLYDRATRNAVRARNWRPPPVPREQAILLGTHPDSGFPVELNINDMCHVLILGPTKRGKNNTAYQIGSGGLRLGRRFEVVGQKGDEVNAVNLLPNSIYLPVRRDPWNDWTPPVGTEPIAFWVASAEAFAIPKLIAPQTQPEFALTLQQMWASAPDAGWVDLGDGFKWKQEQPEGRDKHGTAFNVIRGYATWLGERALVERGVDVRAQYRLIVHGCFGASLDNLEAWIGMRLVREQFEAIQRGASREPRLIMFIPEGQLLFSRELEFARRGNVSFLTRFFAMANSMGISLIVNFQAPSKASAHVLANSATIIVLRQDSFAEASCCAELIGSGPEAIPGLMELPPWVAAVKTPGWPVPVKVRIPYVDLGPPLTPAQLEKRFEADYQRLWASAKLAKRDEAVDAIDWRAFRDPKPDSVRDPAPLLEDHYRFLQDVQEHKSGLKARWDRLGWGVEKGRRRLGELKSAGCVRVCRESSPSPFGGAPKLIVYLTPFGRSMLIAYEARS